MPDHVRLSSTDIYGTTPPPRAEAIDDLANSRPTGALRRRFSRLTLRILAISVFPLATIFGGLMYLGVYERSLIEARLLALGTQARIIAGALGETAVPKGNPATTDINTQVARKVVRRLVRPTQVRARLFDRNGKIIADSRSLLRPGGAIRQEELAPPRSSSWVVRNLRGVYDWFFFLLSKGRDQTVAYKEKPYESASDYGEVQRALDGEDRSMVRLSEHGHLILSSAIPVQRYKNVYGALMLSMPSIEIDRSVRDVRQNVVQIFGVVFVLSLLLSFYLARAIARPINRLALAADHMRRMRSRSVQIPTFPDRQDEIGDLSAALNDLTNELFDRMDAIERFAADVSHELKNPLSSLRSAVETAVRIDDSEKQKRLMTVIEQDVGRLHRLITDIATASRVDAELARTAPMPVDVRRILVALADVFRATAKNGMPEVSLDIPGQGDLTARAIEDRLLQVVQNLIANAVSFSPPGGKILISAKSEKGVISIAVEDRGPGIPPGKEEDIFKRFYSERPTDEAFGQHSGLGLSISKQIVEAVGGGIRAENIVGEDGKVLGARFVMTLRRMTRSGSGLPKDGDGARPKPQS